MAIDKSKYIIHDVDRAYGILPAHQLLSGAKWSHLKSDLPELFPDYKLMKVDKNSSISSIPIDDLHSYFLLKGEDFWEQVIDLMKDCNLAPNPHCEIWGIELYMEADASILTEPVPMGIHGSEKLDENGDSLGQMTFAEWNAGGDQPLRTSNDETKVILRTNIENQCIDQEGVLILNQYSIDNPSMNIVLLNQIQLSDRLQSLDYKQEE